MIVKLASTHQERSDALNIRKHVFIIEQSIPIEIEIDNQDATAFHFIGYLNGKPVCASRLRFEEDYGKLERICVLKENRGHRYGQKLIQTMEMKILSSGHLLSKLNAQFQTKDFYEKLGYQIVSEPFVEADIIHVTMEKHLNRPF